MACNISMEQGVCVCGIQVWLYGFLGTLCSPCICEWSHAPHGGGRGQMNGMPDDFTEGPGAAPVPPLAHRWQTVAEQWVTRAAGFHVSPC